MQLMKFYQALRKSQNPTVNGNPITFFDWEDDGEDGLALRICAGDDCDILIYSTDAIEQGKDNIIVSIGAKDHDFVLA